MLRWVSNSAVHSIDVIHFYHASCDSIPSVDNTANCTLYCMSFQSSACAGVGYSDPVLSTLHWAMYGQCGQTIAMAAAYVPGLSVRGEGVMHSSASPAGTHHRCCCCWPQGDGAFLPCEQATTAPPVVTHPWLQWPFLHPPPLPPTWPTTSPYMAGQVSDRPTSLAALPEAHPIRKSQGTIVSVMASP